MGIQVGIQRQKMPTQSVTKSSHYVSVSQTTSGGTSSSRFLTWNVGGRSNFFCSLPGIIRIIEILLVLIVLIMARVGFQGGQLTFGGVDANFTGIGGSVCLLVILLMFTLSTLIGHLVPNLLEVMTTLVGAVLMITARDTFTRTRRLVSPSGLSPSSQELSSLLTSS